MGLLTAPTVKKLQCPKSKVAVGPILKTVKSPYLCNRLTDFDEIWHGDASLSPALDVKFKFLIFDNLMWQIAAI